MNRSQLIVYVVGIITIHSHLYVRHLTTTYAELQGARFLSSNI
jgi:hypothetical protein